MRSFRELSKRKDELSGLISEVFGDESVGSFGVSITLTPIKRVKRKRRQPVESDGTSDECSQELMNTGFVKDILIEAQRASDRPGVKGMYLSTFEGHGDLQCAWVRESGMSKDAKDWWRLESELRYPGYSDADYPCYDDKENSLGHSLSSGEFLRCLPLALLDSPAPEQSFMELVANPGFNA